MLFDKSKYKYIQHLYKYDKIVGTLYSILYIYFYLIIIIFKSTSINAQQIPTIIQILFELPASFSASFPEFDALLYFKYFNYF